MFQVEPESAIDRLKEFQRAVRDVIVRSRNRANLHGVDRSTAADTIYQIDALIEPVLEDFCRGTKVLASQLMEHLVAHLVGAADTTGAIAFDDQYISTGGQFYEMIVGHDRFIADLRPLFYRIQNQPPGLCCHPYDCATMLIAEEAGVVLTGGLGRPLDGPLGTTTGVAWAGFAHAGLRKVVEPL